MAKPWAISFYNSKAWQDLRWARILQENFRCQDCGEDYTLNPAELIGHHMVTLTPGNIQDKNVAMNPQLIKIVCKKCHDKEHHRFGQHTAQNVFLVYGPPLSGKKTLVNQLAERGDIIVDIDLLWQAVSGCDLHDKPDTLKRNVFAMRDMLIDQVRTRTGHWGSAYIIGGYARKIEREQLAAKLGASLLFVGGEQEALKARAGALGIHGPEWCGYIDKWFRDYQE